MERNALCKVTCGGKSMGKQLWIGAYYPEVMFENERAKALACLIFDKIICHFPVADQTCGSGAGWSEDFAGEDPYVKEGIIELVEEFLHEDVETNFWSTKEKLTHSLKMQVTSMAIKSSQEEGAIPI